MFICRSNIVERDQLNSIINEQKLSLSGLIEAGDYANIGKLASLDGIVLLREGSATYFWFFPAVWYDSTMTAKYIDTTTGQMMWSAGSDYDSFSIIPLIPIHNYEKRMAAALAKRVVEGN